MTAATLGLAIQIIGTAIALLALVSELRAKSDPLPPEQARPRARNLPNPWNEKSRVRFDRVRSADRDRAAGSLVRQMDPDTAALGKGLAGVLAEFRKRAADDWEKQQALARELRSADRDILLAQMAHISQQNRDTRKRVVVEMIGLGVVAIGTVIGSFGG